MDWKNFYVMQTEILWPIAGGSVTLSKSRAGRIYFYASISFQNKRRLDKNGYFVNP
jgi:hypothetical protein